MATSRTVLQSAQADSKWERALQTLKEDDQKQFDRIKDPLDDHHAVLYSVLSAANERKEECMKKRWRINVNGRTIYVRDILEKLCAWVKKIINIGDIAIQYDPVHAALPWAAIRLIMQTGMNDLDNFDYIVVSLENMASILAQCPIIEAVYLGGGQPRTPKLSTQLTESVIGLYAAILQYLAYIMKYLTLSTGKRFITSIGQSQLDFEAKYVLMKQELENFGRLAGIAQAANITHGLDLIKGIEKEIRDRNTQDDSRSQWLKTSIEQLRQPIDRIDVRLQEIHDGLKQDQRAKILKAVSAIRYDMHHKTLSMGRIEGSGAWFLRRSEFNEWRTSSSPSVIWLHGIPGSGKTKLTSLVIDQLLGHEHVAYFYCTRNPAEPERAQCNRILGSLVRQLASVGRNKPILAPVLERYEGAIEGAWDFEDQVWTTDECVGVLLRLFDEYPAVTLVLDALDEVDPDSRQELLDALSNMTQHSTSLIRIFISSRSNYDIQLHLSGTPNVYIEADDNAEDIASFIDKKLDEARLLHGSLSPELRTTIVNTLKSGAQGMFRWVDLQIESLRRIKLAPDLRARLGKLPATLEASYWDIFQQITEFGEHAYRLATFTIQWLLYAQESLPLDGFATLASVALGTEADVKLTGANVLDVCSNLIVEREYSFEFAHLSVREFFEGLQGRRVDSFLREEGHAALAQACLRYLNQALVPVRGDWLQEKIAERILQSEPGESEERVGTEAETEPYLLKVTVGAWRRRPPSPQPRDSHVIQTVISSDADVDIEIRSRYVTFWVMHHITAAGALRLKPPLSDLLKEFVLQPANSSSAITIGRVAWSGTVAPGFRAWTQLPIPWHGRHPRLSTYLLKMYRSIPLWVYDPHASPIWLASYFGWLELVAFLYRHSHDIIDQETYVQLPSGLLKLNPLWYAIAEKKMDLADCIIASTTDETRTVSEKGFQRLLEHAAGHNELDLIRDLVNRFSGRYEVTANAFAAAATQRSQEVIRMMFDLSLAFYDRVEPGGLGSACVGGRVEVVRRLLRNTPTVAGEARFLNPADSAGHTEVVRLLLGKRIGWFGERSTSGIAIWNGYDEIRDLLDQHFARENYAILWRAIENDELEKALRLIEASCEMSGKDERGYSTALHKAAERGHTTIIEALIANQANVNALDYQYRTPLHYAAAGGHIECIELLIDAGADLLIVEGREPTELRVGEGSPPLCCS
ncbi:hypothetical protein F5B18DRAFT_601893 [Nemania serpens]|nr:hypothetical protein F5B18DRAFT_601893 [Nemania serpens]